MYRLGLVFTEVVQQHGSLFDRMEVFGKIGSCEDDDARLSYIREQVTLSRQDNFAKVINRMLAINPDNRPMSSKLEGMIPRL